MRVVTSIAIFLTAAAVSAGELDAAQSAVVKAAKAVRPAVVTVVTPNPRDFDQTGVVVGSVGVILTTRRGLLGTGGLPSEVQVRFPGRGLTLRAKVIDDDEGTNTVVLRARGSRTKPITTGRAEDAIEGMWVLLVGNTFGQGRESTPTVSLGILSGVVRDADGVAEFHASTLVNPGSVGAPVVDLSGDLLGIAAPRVTNSSGQSILIPFERVRAAYAAKGGGASKLLGREPPPRRLRMHVADAFGVVVQDAARRARQALVGIRSSGVLGDEKGTVVEEPPKKGDGKKSPRRRPSQQPARVPGKLYAHDRSSGIIVSPDGLILCPLRITGWPGPTRALTVDFKDGPELSARVLGTDERLRVALLKVEAAGLPVLEPLSFRSVTRAQFVIALGFPHDAPAAGTPEVTFGIISRTGALGALHGEFQAFQTDAGVNGGNRGGPLVDLDGRLLGMLLDVNDTEQSGYFRRLRARYGANSGLGFALPARVIQRLVPKLAAGAHLAAAFLGVEGAATKEGIQVGKIVATNTRGEATTATKAGLRRGDLIVSIAGKPTRTLAELRAALAEHHAGDTIEILYKRDGKDKKVTVELSRR
ncbi:MAG: trypsin-like peptidase domain-containing protein [Planctomycetota bacterium]|nr:trypsin-like peptidase domain-containing protein [Planctomycetota bacterium]